MVVACINLRLKGSDTSSILPSSSAAPALARVSPIDNRFEAVDNGRGTVRRSPVPRCGMLEAEWDLGMAAAAIMGGVNKVGECNGSDP